MLKHTVVNIHVNNYVFRVRRQLIWKDVRYVLRFGEWTFDLHFKSLYRAFLFCEDVVKYLNILGTSYSDMPTQAPKKWR